MKYTARIFFSALMFSVIVALSSSCKAIEMNDLIDELKQATEVQRTAIAKEYKGQMIDGKGIVADVREHDTFDERSDARGRYYKVMTRIQNTAKGNPYRVAFFYKTKDEVKDINKGQAIEKQGAILKIFDERLWISVWLYVGKIGPEEKVMFGDFGALPKDR